MHHLEKFVNYLMIPNVHGSVPDYENKKLYAGRCHGPINQPWPVTGLKRHGSFVAFYFYCKIMLISISYNYCSVILYKLYLV